MTWGCRGVPACGMRARAHVHALALALALAHAHAHAHAHALALALALAGQAAALCLSASLSLRLCLSVSLSWHFAPRGSRGRLPFKTANKFRFAHSLPRLAAHLSISCSPACKICVVLPYKRQSREKKSRGPGPSLPWALARLTWLLALAPGAGSRLPIPGALAPGPGASRSWLPPGAALPVPLVWLPASGAAGSRSRTGSQAREPALPAREPALPARSQRSRREPGSMAAPPLP